MPLNIKNDFDSKLGGVDWKIEKTTRPDSFYFNHLILPKENRVNTRINQNDMDNYILEPKLQSLFRCTPEDSAASIESLIIGLHENYVVTLMAMPKVGNNIKLCRALCGIEELWDLGQVHNSLLVNQFSFQLAINAGNDPRARASLAVRCDNYQDVERLNSFLNGVHQVYPFNQDLARLVRSVIRQSKDFVSIAQKIDESVREKKELGLMHNIIKSESHKIQETITAYNSNIKIIEEQSQWQIPFDVPRKEKFNMFSGYPNGIPDLQGQQKILTFYPPSINQFPKTIPEIHVAILSQDNNRLKKLLEGNPMVIYDRDCYGNLPIELTHQIMQPEMGVQIYEIWDKLPKSQQWAVQVFVENANKLTQMEYHYSSVKEEDIHAGVQAYVDSPMLVRSLLHEQAIRGEMPPIDQFLVEKEHFERYKKSIQDIFQEQCTFLNETLLVIKENKIDLTFVKILGNRTRIKHPYIDLINKYLNHIVINKEEMNLLQHSFDTDFSAYINSEPEKLVLLEHWKKIAAIKLSSIEKIKQCTEDYKKHSLCSDNALFAVSTLTLIFQQASITYQKMFKTKREQQFPLSLINLIQKTIQEKPGVERVKFRAFRSCCHVGGYFDNVLDSIIKSSLLSYEFQDPFGYTPLLLAVANNHIELVKVFFEQGLVSSWIKPLSRGDFLHYSLLSHAQSREMMSLLLRYYTDPNTTFVFHEGLERSIPVLLMYHHKQQHCLDTHKQSLLDYIASGQPYNLDYLNTLLFYREVAVQDGPYDPSMPEAVQIAFKQHNERILKKLKNIESRPKIEKIGCFFQEPWIRTYFKVGNNRKGFYSVLKKLEQLTLGERENLALLFAASFRHPDDFQSDEHAINFFKNKVLKNKNYIFELFYQEQGGAAIGFFCFQVKIENDPVFGRSLLVHLSLAGCATQFDDQGLFNTSAKVLLALKKCSNELGIPMSGYGRYGRPGIAYLMIPPEAVSSPKYHFPRNYIKYVAGVFGNTIEENCSSIPPVFSKAKLNGIRHKQLDEYDFLLDECLHAGEDASLPVIFEMSDILTDIWYKKLSESTGITERQVQTLYEQVEPWVIDEDNILTVSNHFKK